MVIEGPILLNNDNSFLLFHLLGNNMSFFGKYTYVDVNGSGIRHFVTCHPRPKTEVDLSKTAQNRLISFKLGSVLQLRTAF